MINALFGYVKKAVGLSNKKAKKKCLEANNYRKSPIYGAWYANCEINFGLKVGYTKKGRNFNEN
jgi:hypothetical protein